MKKIILVIAICLTTVIFLLGFVDRGYSETIENTADITYAINGIPKDFKSVGNLTKRQQDIICATSRGLIEIDIDGNIIPSLAESVDIRDEGIEYEFKFKDNIYWSDGSKITPNDFLIFLREVITEENENDTLFNIFGVKDYVASDKSFNETVGITANEESLIIRLNSPDDNFLIELSKPQYRLRKNLLFWENINYNYKKIVYSGNYYIQEIQNEQIALERSVKAITNLPQTIHLVVDEDEHSALAAFEVGERDIVINPPKSQLERLREEGKIVTLPSDKAIYLTFNENINSLSQNDKKNLYKLINKATLEYDSNSDALIDIAEYSYFRQSGEELEALQSRNVMINIDSNEDDNDIENIYIVAEETLENKDYLNFLSIWFETNTKINLIVEMLNEEEFQESKIQSYYDIQLINIDASLENGSNFIEIISDYIEEDVVENLKEASNEEEREIVFSQIEDSLFNNYKILPLLFYNENIALNNKVKNINLDRNGNIDFNNIEK